MTPQLAARIFVCLTLMVAAFQLALAMGAPWGAIAMGGAFPGALPPPLRFAALAQIMVLALAALVILSRAGCALPAWRRASNRLVWIVVGLFGIGVVLNLITPSAWERAIWTPVALGLFLTSLGLARSR